MPLVAAAVVGDLVVDGLVTPGDAPVRLHVHQGERRGFFTVRDSGDDLYLFWIETTPGPARSPLLPPCAELAAAADTPATACGEEPPTGGRRAGPFRIRERGGQAFAELAGLGRDTEQWIWQPVPARLAATPPTDDRGWSWDAAAWGVGVPLLLPEPVAPPPPTLIGHRGSPGRLPDHTLEGYALAVAQGADAIEPDLVATRDGVLVARHDTELSRTTDVSARFPSRKRTAVVDGQTLEGWFVEDFTLAELRTLRAVQPMAGRPHDHDGEYGIPTFDEILELAARLGAERGRPVGVIPELKHPTYFRSLGLPLEPLLNEALARSPVPLDHVVVQSFEPSAFDALASGPRRLLLIDAPGAVVPGDSRTYGELLADLPALRQKVDALGVSREVVWAPPPPPTEGGAPATPAVVVGPTGFLERAQAAVLCVYVWTFRAEQPGPAGNGDPLAEIEAFLHLGVDGVFADQPDVAAEARARLAAPR